jgi:hypothetical protein
MSDVQQRPDWWQAVDGLWYPPERHPNYRAPQTGPPATTGSPAYSYVEPPQQQPRAPAAPEKPIQVEVTNLPATLHTNACAIISLALALVLPVPLAAIIFGWIGTSQIARAERSGVRERGRALAIWGIILGILELAVFIYFIVRALQQANCNSTFQNC